MDDASAGLDLGANLTLPEGPAKRYGQYISGLGYASPERTFGEDEDAFLSACGDSFRELGRLSSTNFEFVFGLNISKKHVRKTG